ncbi:EAL domain-containing protein [Rhodoferax sp. U11-2br]|uniref:bifunctional diguanylate cyclase/phosphodiesterase n=1 Tax=Rhodoferax sp. U11-2br TaxID=2838878 RepID=UPI001BEB797D|nr:EAL domain-containing protein [Rhodoferax sp. U11-2br]MBT3069042.1 EAL domain-containing protein [Rhodoferax sp. U11-2br]
MRRETRRTVNTLFLAEWLLCAGLLLSLGAYIGYAKYLDHQLMSSSEQERLANQARVIEKNLASQLVSANRALEGLLADLATDAAPRLKRRTLNGRLKLMAETLTGMSPLLITDASGRVTHASIDSLVGFDASQRAYFQTALRQRGQGVLHVSAPFVSSLGRPSMALVRDIQHADGQFGGVVVAVVESTFSGVLLDSVRFTPDTQIALFHGDGQLFVSAPYTLGQDEVNWAQPDSVFGQHKNLGWATSAFTGTTDASGELRQVALRTVQPPQLAMDKALVVMVSRDVSAIHANWRRETSLLGGAFGAVSLAVFLALYIHQRRQRVFDKVTHQREMALRDSDARLQSIFEATPDALLISDEHGIITMVNQQVTPLLGYAMAELLGKPIEDLVPMPSRAAHHRLREGFGADTQTPPRALRKTIKALRKDGSECHVEVSLSRIETNKGLFFASALRDISERQAADEIIRKLAFYDQLTGLPNRTLLVDRLKQVIAAGHRHGTFGAMLFIDLDHFKTLNDTLGHDVGDLQLQQVAGRVVGCVRDSDTVARVGGDEFAVILAGLGQSEVEAVKDIELVSAKILAVLSLPYQLGEVTHTGSASIGATMFLGQAASIDDLMRQADLAMYRAKDMGRNGVHFFDPTMETVMINRVAMEKDLRSAVSAGQFELHYQAQVMALGRVTGAEVLVRWRHPTRGMVSPADFIPLAEETGVILQLGQWVLETTCCQLAKWQNCSGLADLVLAVNVSALQLAQPDFVRQVMLVVERAGINPKHLKLELTESLLVGNVDDIIEKMGVLKSQGIGFSMDDFGTGYSSLSYLGRLPLDQLKIDRSFVSEVLTNTNSAGIAKTIITLAQGLGLSVIAEGVETDAQRAFLASAGCYAYQGYFFSRPLMVEDFEALVLRP